MCNYNCATFIAEAVESIIAQTYKNWEIIFYDDASNDNSMAIIDKYKDKNIRIVHGDCNLGYGGALSNAVQYATKQTIALVDSDDTILPTALEEVKEVYDAMPKIGMVYTQFHHCNKDLIPIKTGSSGKIPNGLTYLEARMKTRGRPNVSHLKTFAKSAYDRSAGFGNYRRSADKDIVFKLEEVTKLHFLNKKLYNYRDHANNTVKSTITMEPQIIQEALKRRAASRVS